MIHIILYVVSGEPTALMKTIDFFFSLIVLMEHRKCGTYPALELWFPREWKIWPEAASRTI